MKNFTDTEIRIIGFDVLSNVLGDVNAERFIALTIREPQDYTAWRERNMYVGESIEDTAARARAAARRYDEEVWNSQVEGEESLDNKINAYKARNRELQQV